MPALVGQVEPQLFPKRLTLKGPTSQEMLDRFQDTKAWVRDLQAQPHVHFKMREIRHRVLGVNSIPEEAWIWSADDAVALLGKRQQARSFVTIVGLTNERCPVLLPWLSQRPLQALELADAWPSLLSVVEWLHANPRPGIYLRQVDLPGIHTKFIENHRGALSELLDLALPPHQVELMATGIQQFNPRYGFLEPAERIRFRVLDPACPLLPGLTTPDVTLDSGDFSRMGRIAKRVFITENLTNFLAFPLVEDSIVIFGAGYGLRALGSAAWLTECEVYYWGDLDTHGFAILDELRTHLAHVESFLMDRQTLMAHQEQWGHEDSPASRDLQRLRPSELALYNDLRDNRMGRNIRLEQERIGFGGVEEALRRVILPSS